MLLCAQSKQFFCKLPSCNLFWHFLQSGFGVLAECSICFWVFTAAQQCHQMLHQFWLRNMLTCRQSPNKINCFCLQPFSQLLNNMHNMVCMRFLPFSCSRVSSVPRSTAHSFLPSSPSSSCCPRTRKALVSWAGDNPNAGRWLTYTTLEEEPMDYHRLHLDKFFPYIW